MTPFRPHPLAVGGHRQTLLGYWCRRRLRWDLPAEDLVVDAAEGVRLLLRVTWQPGKREARPAVVIVHGLEGSDQATYALAMGLHASRLGWHVVRMNMRGVGDSAALCPLLYNAGLDSDLMAVLDAVASRTPRYAIVGFSLGANLALLALARSAARLPPGLAGVVAVSPPLDLAACVAAVDRPANKLYQRYFMNDLRQSYERRQRLRPGLYAPGLGRRARTIREYDEIITARYGGYRDADDYYARSSAGPLLARIDRPALVLAAVDDPMVPVATVERCPLPASGCVRRELMATGGHVGFVAPTRAPGRFWAAERAADYLMSIGSFSTAEA